MRVFSSCLLDENGGGLRADFSIAVAFPRPPPEVETMRKKHSRFFACAAAGRGAAPCGASYDNYIKFTAASKFFRGGAAAL